MPTQTSERVAPILPVYNLVQRLRGKRQSGEAVTLAITPTAPGWPSGNA